jgi:UDP-2,3-diacylglucosamine pyrophosphatase LpxH
MMRIAVISDTHFGDPASVLIEQAPNGGYRPGKKYADFLAAAGTDNDYLVLLGDILDFSVASYGDAIAVAKAFFLQIQRDKVARECIYVPGNHDFDIWHTVEYETNIINRLKDHQPPRPFRLSVPGVLDLRAQVPSSAAFRLYGVSVNVASGLPKYAGLFLDDITTPDGPEVPFNFVYPNLYVIVDDVSSVLFTHGQYLEAWWSLAGEWLVKLAADDLHVGTPLGLRDLVALNFPLSQLACSGVGQAGPLTEVVRAVEHEVKEHKTDRVRVYLDRFHQEVSTQLRLGWLKEWFVNKAFAWAENTALGSLGKMEDARYSEEFVRTPEVMQHFLAYFAASLLEIKELNQNGYNIPLPRIFVFGHTHQPIPLTDPQSPVVTPETGSGVPTVTLHNTGGWLVKREDDKTVFCGAEVFRYEPGAGLSSVSVR